MQERVNNTVNGTAKKATRATRDVAERVKDRITETTGVGASPDFSLEGLFASFKSMLQNFDETPLKFVKDNPLRATIGGFFIGLIFGAAMSKRSVTK